MRQTKTRRKNMQSISDLRNYQTFQHMYTWKSCQVRNKCEETMANLFPQMTKNHKLTDGRYSTNPKQKKSKKPHHDKIESIFSKTEIKRKCSKMAIETCTLHTAEYRQEQAFKIRETVKKTKVE